MRRRVAAFAAAVLGLGVAAFLLPQTGTPNATTASALTCGAEPGVLTSGGAIRIPIAGPFTVTSEYGMRVNPTDGVYRLHAGLDLSSSAPAPIVAMAGGTVTFAGDAGTAGNMVVIDHGESVSTRSLHLSQIMVRQGQAVTAGQQIGVEGTTGDSTGLHLHFEVKISGATVDPRSWLTKAGVAIPPLGGWSTGGGTLAVPAGGGPVGAARAPKGCDAGVVGLNAGAVPAEFAPWVIKAGTLCRAVPAAIIAAQIETESGWNPKAVSPAGAQGASQFIPATWAAYGRDDDGNGVSSPFDIGDAVMAQGRYDCAIAAVLQDAVPGDLVDLTLAGYNAGPGAVLLAHGIPSMAETQAYVPRIRELARSKYGVITPATPSRGSMSSDPATTPATTPVTTPASPPTSSAPVPTASATPAPTGRPGAPESTPGAVPTPAARGS